MRTIVQPRIDDEDIASCRTAELQGRRQLATARAPAPGGLRCISAPHWDVISRTTRDEAVASGRARRRSGARMEELSESSRQ